jgi:hypothetical protein
MQRAIGAAAALGIAVLAITASAVASGGAVPASNRSQEAARSSRASRAPAFWTVREAESIATVRGTPIHVEECRGLGRAQRKGPVVRYGRFACVGGTGLPWEDFDSVAVTYVLRPLGAYDGGCSAYAVTDVHFMGVGIP